MPADNVKCTRVFTPPYSEEEQVCGHPYIEHARDMNHTEEHCWHNAVIGDCCQCPGFLSGG